MASILIDGREYSWDGQPRNLLELCLSLGLEIPYFCWHPALGSVGACRQCAVKLYRGKDDPNGRIVMSCMTAAVDGQRISIRDPEVTAFRAQIIEWLMVNHPHDCPVCDEGGECHLQDMTVLTGHVYRRSRFRKRTFRNQNLGPFVAQEMNRCIQCYRCVRFYRDYAGGQDFGVFGWHDRLFFGRVEDGTLESPFSGNLVEVCPTGVFTDRTLREHYTRGWDLQTAPSVCQHCSLGCNTWPGERYGTVRRVRNRYNRDVNGYFLCDRGRYGYQFVDDPGRLLRVEERAADGSLRPVPEARALERLAPALGRAAVLGIGSPRASLEANFALRELVGPERFYPGLARAELELLSRALALLERGPAAVASLGQARASDAVLVLGEDLTNTAPLLALAVRQASRQQGLRSGLEGPSIPPWDDGAARAFLQDQRGPCILATPARTALEDLATHSLHTTPTELARFGFAVARALDPSAPEPQGLGQPQRELAAQAAAALREAGSPLVVSGTGCGEPQLLEAAAAVAAALVRAGRPAKLSFALPECNSLGLALLEAQRPLEEALEQLRSGRAEALLIVENDLFRRWTAEAVTELLERASLVVVVDHLRTRTAAKAHLLLPAASFAEAEGTLVNNEGRAQRFFKVRQPQPEVRESWRWLTRLASKAPEGRGEARVEAQAEAPDPARGAARASARDGQGLDELLAELARKLPRLAAAREAAPPSSFRLDGQKVPRQPARYTGRTSMTAHLDVHEPRPPADPDSPLSFSMEGYPGRAPASLAPRLWAPGWNSVQALTRGPWEESGPGAPLLRPRASGPDAPAPYPPKAPEALAPRPGELQVVAAWHLFGSEEQSSRSRSASTLLPAPYLGLGEEEARSLGAAEGELVSLQMAGAVQRLPVRLVPGLPRGLALLPAGLPERDWVELPSWGRVLPEGRT
jgi:NADH-quinone oxidoreductase subunit G